MLVSCWSVKGGSGTTVVATALALLLARSARAGVLLVDLGGDAPAVLGLPEPDGPGALDWVAAGPATPADALARLEVPAAPGLSLLPSGPTGSRASPGGAAAGGSAQRPPGSDAATPSVGTAGRADLLAAVLAADPRPVVADCGVVPAGPGAASPADGSLSVTTALALAASASVSLLVVRPCFLALRRAVAAPLRPSGVVLVTEPGRAIGAGDVEDALGVPVRAEVAWDPAVARAVDAGSLGGRLPRTLWRALRRAA